MTVRNHNIVSMLHIGITVSDLDASIAFWRDVMDFEVGEKRHRSGPALESITGVPGAAIDTVFIASQDHTIELLHFVSPRTVVPSNLRACDPGFLHLCFKVKNMEQVLKSVEATGFRPLGPVQLIQRDAAGPSKVVYTRNQDGLVIEFVE